MIKTNMTNKIILFLAPLPPPFAGPEVTSEMLLMSDAFKNASIYHIKSNIRIDNASKGKRYCHWFNCRY